MLKSLRRWYLEPDPTRIIALRLLDRLFGVLDYETRLKIGSIERPVYGHCLLKAAQLAHKLQIGRISAIEFGVAGGNGLLALEKHAKIVTEKTGVEIAIYGFDSGEGMPSPKDYRDIPYLWQQGYFKIDLEKLRSKLRVSKLVLGPVHKTVREFCEKERPPPIGFVVFDLDFYSSTMDAFALFGSSSEFMLPRIACYFDDIVGDIEHAFSDFAGELLAISEFNAAHADIKIAPVGGLRFFDSAIPRSWHEQVFLVHLFGHCRYATPISQLTELPLTEAHGRRVEEDHRVRRHGGDRRRGIALPRDDVDDDVGR